MAFVSFQEYLKTLPESERQKIAKGAKQLSVIAELLYEAEKRDSEKQKLFYAYTTKDTIVIVSAETKHPFDQLEKLWKTLKKLSKNIDKTHIDVVFNLIPYHGKITKSSVFLASYDKKANILVLLPHSRLTYEQFKKLYL